MDEKNVLVKTIKESLQNCNDLELLYFIQGILAPYQPQPQTQTEAKYQSAS